MSKLTKDAIVTAMSDRNKMKRTFSRTNRPACKQDDDETGGRLRVAQVPEVKSPIAVHASAMCTQIDHKGGFCRQEIGSVRNCPESVSAF